MSKPIDRAAVAAALHAYADAIAAGTVPVPAMRHDEVDGYRMRIVPRVVHNVLCAWRVASSQETDPVVLGCAGCGLCYPSESVDPTGMTTGRPVDVFLATQPDADLSMERPYVYSGGPWAGRVRLEPRAIVPQHCMPQGEDGGKWAAADAWTGQERYVPEGGCGDPVQMVWRGATAAEVQAAIAAREERYAEKDWSE